jgi:anthranilate synthase/aminodeoxychorismate synthase-like glutamine amidotransferase
VPVAVPDVVVVDHHDSYTWNLVHLVAGVTGALPTVVQHDEVTAREVLDHDFVVLSPGPGHPADPSDFAVGREVLLAGSRPVLGVCLGMQGIITTFGGTVERHIPAHGEVSPIEHDGAGVFTGLPQAFKAVRYHSLQGIDLPSRLTLTATCPGADADGPPAFMGVRHTELPIEGVQFHPESVLTPHGKPILRNFLA